MELVNSESISGFRQSMIDRGRLRATVDAYNRDIVNFLTFLTDSDTPHGAIGLETLESFKNWQINKGSRSSSVRRSVIAIRMFFRWLDERGSIHGSPFDDAPVPAHDHCKAREITPDQVQLMIAGSGIQETRLKSLRDTVLIFLLAHEGLKVSELTLLSWTHFFAAGASGRLSIPGDRARTIGLEAETTEAILSYRHALSEDHRTKNQLTGAAPLIVSFKGADARAVQFGITRHGLKFAVYEIGQLANLRQLNAEQLRHAAMEHKLSLGFTPEMLMNHLGLRRIGNIGKHLSAAPSDAPTNV